MKHLRNLCNPRKFDMDTDVLDIGDLVEDRINPSQFFETNYKTQGMSVLFRTAFEHFMGKSPQSLIKLTQSMGGGKTHNMISLGLLAKHPDFRNRIIGDHFKEDGSGKVNVLAFSGRESNSSTSMLSGTRSALSWD
jgi:hypothetical protein